MSFEEEFIRISEVFQYIFKKVPERQPEQRPYANLQIYDDFIISYLPQELRQQVNDAQRLTAELNYKYQAELAIKGQQAIQAAQNHQAAIIAAHQAGERALHQQRVEHHNIIIEKDVA